MSLKSIARSAQRKLDVGKYSCNLVLGWMTGVCEPLALAALATGLEVVIVGCLWFVQYLFAGHESFGI